MRKEFIETCIKMARENVEQGLGGPFAAIIVKDNQIISRGTNTVTKANDPTAHAEIMAIREAAGKLNNYDLSGCELYSSCEPCPMCLSAIYWARIGRVYFAAGKQQAANAGFDDAFIYEQLSKPLDKRSIQMIQVETTDTGSPFQAWDDKDDKVLY
jgi:guanine deaminase